MRQRLWWPFLWDACVGSATGSIQATWVGIGEGLAELRLHVQTGGWQWKGSSERLSPSNNCTDKVVRARCSTTTKSMFRPSLVRVNFETFPPQQNRWWSEFNCWIPTRRGRSTTTSCTPTTARLRRRSRRTGRGLSSPSKCTSEPHKRSGPARLGNRQREERRERGLNYPPVEAEGRNGW